MPNVIGGKPTRPRDPARAVNTSISKPLLIALISLAALALILYAARALFIGSTPPNTSTLVKDPTGPAIAQPSGPSAGTTLGAQNKDAGVVEPSPASDPTPGKESGAGNETPGG
jgi:hypothetical protein